MKYMLENGRFELDFCLCYFRFKVGYVLFCLSNVLFFVCVCLGRVYC